FRLRLAALQHYRDLHTEFDLTDLLRFGGSLWWEDQGEAFDAHVALLASFDYRSEVVDAQTFAELEPNVKNPPDRALHAPEEAGIALAGMTRWLLEQASVGGASVQTGAGVEELVHAKGQVTGVKTAMETLHADHVIIAAGVMAGELLAPAGFDLPMNNNAGLILRSAPLPPLVNHVIMSPDVHFRQDPDGSLLMGEIFSGSFEEGRDIAALRESVLKLVAARLDAPAPIVPAQTMLGIRPMPSDGMPAIGPVPGMTGLSVAVMHSAATLGPMIGHLLARELIEGQEEPLLATFRPSRFQA
ncbi:MAG: NAD(P)/FAD-dependent oxidoreductase, partial [Alphaproteobacteria bacterium]